jgi:hypothetical protein
MILYMLTHASLSLLVTQVAAQVASVVDSSALPLASSIALNKEKKIMVIIIVMSTFGFEILQPLRLLTLGCNHIKVEDLLYQMMSPDSLVWMYQDMPTVNPVCSILSHILRAQAYLMQRDSRALTRSALTRYGYWSQSSLGLLQSVLGKLGSPQFSDIRRIYLNLV